MRRQHILRTLPISDKSIARLADPMANAKTISLQLLPLIESAEAAGLSIIASHLQKALILSNKVAASGGTGSLTS